jgi:hypothetical protein
VPSRVVVFILFVDFMSDFLATFATGIGVGVAGSANTASSPVPSRWMVYVAVLGGFVTAFRGIKRNLTNLVTSVTPVTSVSLVPQVVPQDKGVFF